MIKLLVLGVARSGTTLLASMLGGHPDISMLDESDHIDKLVGTKYVGTKYPLGGGAIMYDLRHVPFFGAIFNRMLSLGRKKQLLRILPLCKYSIKDFIKQGAKVILIVRNKEDIINSNVKRGKMSRWMATIRYNEGIEIASLLNPDILITYKGLIEQPEKVMRLICNKLELEYSDKMLEGAKYNKRYGRSLGGDA